MIFINETQSALYSGTAQKTHNSQGKCTKQKIIICKLSTKQNEKKIKPERNLAKNLLNKIKNVHNAREMHEKNSLS